jgi:uncharacterized protein (TIGR02145 family)
MNISTYKEQKAKASLFGKIGIFSASLLTAASAVYIYSPIIGSHADESTNLKVDATVNPVASLTLDTSNVSFTFTPTASGVFESKPVNATVNTNSTGGYELYFSSEDNETNMVNPLTSDAIASDFTGTVTESTMAANKWGYSLNNTDFSKIPTLASPATLKNVDHFPTTAEKTTTVDIGMKVDTNLPSGTYSKNVVFSVVAHATPLPPFEGISTMQEMTPEIAENAPVGTTATLTDTRDGNTYTVKKLADGKVWMAQNLRLINKTITSSDSNVSSDFTVPNNNWSSTLDLNDKYINAYTYQTNDTSYGVYYNYCAASAGTVCSKTAQQDAEEDVCPKGWKLPSQTEQRALLSAYGATDNNAGSTIMRSEPLNFVYSGLTWYNVTTPANQGTYGYWWASTAYNENNSFRLYISDNYANANGSSNRNSGIPVRCVAQ